MLPLNLDMVIEPDAACEPVGILDRNGRQWFQRRPVQLRDQRLPAGAQMARDFAVEAG